MKEYIPTYVCRGTKCIMIHTVIVSISERGSEKLGDSVKKNLILYIPLINRFYIACIPIRKKSYKKQVWKYLIAHKIEFNMKSIMRQLQFSKIDKRSFHYRSWIYASNNSFKIYKTSTTRNAKRNWQTHNYRDKSTYF